MSQKRKKIEAKSVTLAVRVTPTFAREVRELADRLGIREAEWLRRACLMAAVQQVAVVP